MNRKLVLAAVASSGLGLGIYALSTPGKPGDAGGAAPARAEGSGAPAAAKESAPAQAGRPARALGAGKAFVYDVTATRSMGAPGAAPSLVTNISGALSLTVVGPVEEGAAVRVALASAKRTDTPAREDTPAASALETPFFIVLRPDGAVASWHFPRVMPGDARRQLRSIVSALQIVVDERAPSWERTETDEAGQYVAGYTADGATLTKKKLRYELVRGPQGFVPVATIGEYQVAGASAITLDSTAWPATVEEATTTTVTFQGGRLAMVAKTRARLVSTSDDRRYLGSFEAAMPTFDPDTDGLGEDAALAARNADKNLVGSATLAQLVGDYEAGDRKGRARAVARLGALLRTDPGSVQKARERLLAKDTKEATARALASALGAAGNKEAQRALADALGSKEVPASVKNDAAISLGLTEKPTADARAALKSAASGSGDVAQTATLALGNMAASLAKEGGDAKDIVDDLLAKLEAATTPDQKVLFLDALGNTGDPRALPAIRAHVASGDGSVRAAAVSALRFQKAPEVDPLLLVVVRDPEVLVRKAVLSAIAQREVAPLLPALEHVLHEDPIADLRKTAIRILARHVDTVPEAAQLLAWASQNDQDPEVKQAATDALSRPK